MRIVPAVRSVFLLHKTPKTQAHSTFPAISRMLCSMQRSSLFPKPFLLARVLVLCLSLILLACSSGKESPLYHDSSTPPSQQETPRPSFQQSWTMSPGLLRGQLERWTSLAGYQLVWKVSRDYYLQSPIVFQDTFPNALKKLFTGLQERGNSLRATIYNGNMVVLVSEE